jgi:predicted nucleotidyltransferase
MAETLLDVPMQLSLPRGEFLDACRRHHVYRLAVFGSVLRDDFRRDSDIDFLVKFENDDAGPWMSRLTELQEDLARVLGRPVDVVDWNSVERSRNPYRRDAILGEMKLLYVA